MKHICGTCQRWDIGSGARWGICPIIRDSADPRQPTDEFITNRNDECVADRWKPKNDKPEPKHRRIRSKQR